MMSFANIIYPDALFFFYETNGGLPPTLMHYTVMFGLVYVEFINTIYN